MHRHDCFEVLGVGGDGDPVVAEADFGQSEAGPVEVGVELVGDGNVLRRGGGGGFVLKVDSIRKRGGRGDVAGGAEASGGEFLVGVGGRGGAA